jgi:hypothetical protein
MPGGIGLLLAAIGVGLLATVVLAAWLTPRTWWRRANARALAVLAAGTAGIGGLLLWLVAPSESASAAPPAPVAVAGRPLLLAGNSYRVYQDLNLRAASGVGSRRLAVLPAGASVTATGARDGDWWQVNAQVDGGEVSGWTSSLWLRRSDERLR